MPDLPRDSDSKRDRARPVSRCAPRERTGPAGSASRAPRARTTGYDPTAASSGVAAAAELTPSSEDMSVSFDRQLRA